MGVPYVPLVVAHRDFPLKERDTAKVLARVVEQLDGPQPMLRRYSVPSQGEQGVELSRQRTEPAYKEAMVESRNRNAELSNYVRTFTLHQQTLERRISYLSELNTQAMLVTGITFSMLSSLEL
eukprot:7181292-Prymnesium_polylepis.1